jgi:cytidylate kinase
VICISRELGSGGELVGLLVAEELGFAYVDEEIITRAAAEAGLHPAAVRVEEERRSLARRAFDALAASGPELPGGGAVLPTPDQSAEIRAYIRNAIVETAARGRVVIVAHAASFAVSPSPTALRVLIAGTPTARARRLAREGRDEGEAAHAVASSDESRHDYLKRFYGVERELPTHYDLVLNTDHLDADRAASIVVRAAMSGADP